VVEAEEGYRQSLRAAMDYGNTLQAGMEIQGMAMAIAGQGRLEQALRLSANPAGLTAVPIGREDLSTLVSWERFGHQR